MQTDGKLKNKEKIEYCCKYPTIQNMPCTFKPNQHHHHPPPFPFPTRPLPLSLPRLPLSLPHPPLPCPLPTPPRPRLHHVLRNGLWKSVLAIIFFKHWLCHAPLPFQPILKLIQQVMNCCVLKILSVEVIHTKLDGPKINLRPSNGWNNACIALDTRLDCRTAMIQTATIQTTARTTKKNYRFKNYKTKPN